MLTLRQGRLSLSQIIRYDLESDFQVKYIFSCRKKKKKFFSSSFKNEIVTINTIKLYRDLKRKQHYHKMEKSEQITSTYDYEESRVIPYDESNMLFAAAEKGEIPVPPNAPKTAKPISYFTMGVGTKYPDGTMGPLIFETDECFTFGVSENTNMTSGDLDGYVLPIAMVNKDEPTEAQSHLVDILENKCLPRCKKALVEEKTSVEKYDLEDRDLKDLKILYWKTENGKRVANQGPIWYAKLITSKKKGMKIFSRFFLMGHQDKEGNPIELDPLKLLGQYGIVKAYITVERIFVGSKIISIQSKLRECYFKPIEMGLKRISKPKSDTLVTYDPNQGSSSVSALLLVKGQKNHRKDDDEKEAKEAKESSAPQTLSTNTAIVRRNVTADKK